MRRLEDEDAETTKTGAVDVESPGRGTDGDDSEGDDGRSVARQGFNPMVLES